MVPAVKFTKGATTAAGTRVESGSTSDIECETDYQYGGQETSTVTCDVSLDNNGYPSSCRSQSALSIFYQFLSCSSLPCSLYHLAVDYLAICNLVSL